MTTPIVTTTRKITTTTIRQTTIERTTSQIAEKPILLKRTTGKNQQSTILIN